MFRWLERLLVFPAPPVDSADWNPPDLPFEDVFFSAGDGTKLHGWYVPHLQPRAVVLYCHGNGEHVADVADGLRVLHTHIGVTVFAWDYRSYGRSEGLPDSTNTIADARSAQLWLAKRVGIAPEQVVVIGRSLGGSVAVALAARHPILGLVLDRTYSRLVDTAAHRFPWLPVRWIMRFRFPSIDRIRRYHGPLLQTHGTDDEVIPFAMGRQLFDASPSKQKRFVEVPGGKHGGLLPEVCYEALLEFLNALP